MSPSQSALHFTKWTLEEKGRGPGIDPFEVTQKSTSRAGLGCKTFFHCFLFPHLLPFRLFSRGAYTRGIQKVHRKCVWWKSCAWILEIFFCTKNKYAFCTLFFPWTFWSTFINLCVMGAGEGCRESEALPLLPALLSESLFAGRGGAHPSSPPSHTTFPPSLSPAAFTSLFSNSQNMQITIWSPELTLWSLWKENGSGWRERQISNAKSCSPQGKASISLGKAECGFSHSSHTSYTVHQRPPESCVSFKKKKRKTKVTFYCNFMSKTKFKLLNELF